MMNDYNNIAQLKIKQSNKQALIQVIEKGIELMRTAHLNEQLVEAWTQYAISILSLMDKTLPPNQSVTLQFLQFKLTILNQNLDMQNKLYQYIQYLINLNNLI
ncbi:MAG: hypothetical protein BEN19_04140 [Epulopiscium sp. Nuni2H_MBin003]|nr:MAG: hypothetical protein BEN19_04140 [Epulopiscium sp. Nuni2H_MBin003]